MDDKIVENQQGSSCVQNRTFDNSDISELAKLLRISLKKVGWMKDC